MSGRALGPGERHRAVEQEVIWKNRYAARTHLMESSIIREILKLTQQADMISFAGGLPGPDVFPVHQIGAATGRVLSRFGAQALQYSTTEGYEPLREMIAGHGTLGGLASSPGNVLITSGSQQALDLLGKIFIDPGDRVVVESPTYLGALQAWNAYGAQYLAVPSDEQGMVTDGGQLEDALMAGPKFIYVMPSFQNPAGTTLPLHRRTRLLELARRYGVPIVEDDPYSHLRYEGEHLPALVALDGNHPSGSRSCYNGCVIYLSTFSKILAPGLRLAWVAAPPEIIRKLVLAKQGADLHTGTLTQMVAYEAARDGFLDRHIDLIRRAYRQRRDVMLAAMNDHFPDSVRHNRPEGGLFIWCTLPEAADAAELLKAAVERKVAFVPGAPFYAGGGGTNTMRVNFSNATEDQIREGIARLGGVLKERLRELA
ncbi:MAG: PLP-dependent aminotransferase family protein [Firmicutes bacterium]|nr:PLP-dependent aminotransferase family protein [Bacillota bacterium]